MENRHYLYRHSRLDKNEPFYIGIGTKEKRSHPHWESEYRRAYVWKERENKIWKRIINKTKYKVEIMVESNDYEFIKQKEIEFIKLYGRIDLGTGTLANLTDGAEGIINRIDTEERKRKFREKMIGRKQSDDQILNRIISREGYQHSEDTKKKISNSNKGKKPSQEHLNKLFKGQLLTNCKPILQYDLDGNFIKEWESSVVAARSLSISPISIRNCAVGKVSTSVGFVWIDKSIGKETPKKIEVSDKVKRVKQLYGSTRLYKGVKQNLKKVKLIDNLTKEEIIYNTIEECSVQTGIPYNSINSFHRNKRIYKNKFLIQLL